ncbi:MAG: NAD(P)H-dependent oxidoreductase [Chloroflexi bacterium]|nr:NAD(P)H-dependent oxidoreductase [Chloroflexota bacterium]MCL5735662.1 NAD(P)H-dependent oxidoreductase [Actinomycetota bacterium]
MEFPEVVRQRYATKRFDGRTLPQGKIDELLELIRLAPSALNLQPWKIKVISDPEMKATLAPATGNPEMTTTASHILVFCADTEMETLVGKTMDGMVKAGVPGQIMTHVRELCEQMVLCLDTQQRKEWSTHQVFLALGNAVNGAKALGFDSCPVTEFKPEEFRRILNVPAHLFPVVICPLGYGAQPANPKLRFPLEDILL